MTLLSVPHLHDPSHSSQQSLLDYRGAYVSAISVAFRKNETPVTRPVVLRQARDSEGAVHDRGCAGHWFARFFFEVLVIFFGVCAEIVFQESPFGFVSLLRVLQQISPASLEGLLVLLPGFIVRVRLSWLPLRVRLSKRILIGGSENHYCGYGQQQHRCKPKARAGQCDPTNDAIHCEPPCP
jgi:hypothetical protein